MKTSVCKGFQVEITVKHPRSHSSLDFSNTVSQIQPKITCLNHFGVSLFAAILNYCNLSQQ